MCDDSIHVLFRFINTLISFQDPARDKLQSHTLMWWWGKIFPVEFPPSARYSHVSISELDTITKARRKLSRLSSDTAEIDWQHRFWFITGPVNFNYLSEFCMPGGCLNNEMKTKSSNIFFLLKLKPNWPTLIINFWSAGSYWIHSVGFKACFAFF